MDLSKYRQLYVSETQENLEKISQLLVELETKPNDRRAIDTVFRLVHSIKGMSGTMGYTPVFELAHHLEDLMDRFRRLQVPMSTAAIDVILAGADRVGQWLGDVEAEHLPLRKDAAAETLHRRIQELLDGRLEGPEALPPTRRRSGPVVAPMGSAASELEIEPGDIVITAEMEPSSPDPGLRAFLLYKKLTDLGRVRSTQPHIDRLRQGLIDGPVQFVFVSNLDVTQIEGYLSLVPDLQRVHVRREDPPRATTMTGDLGQALLSLPTPPPIQGDALGALGTPQADEPGLELTFSPDFETRELIPPRSVDGGGGGGGAFLSPSATPLPAGFSEFDFEDVLGDTVRESVSALLGAGGDEPRGVAPERRPTRAPMDAIEVTSRLTPTRAPPLRAEIDDVGDAGDAADAPEGDDGTPLAEAAIVRAPRATRSVRVRTDWLDAVLNRTGDLLIISQRLWNRNQANPDSVTTETLSELSRVLSALHQDALSVRMTPLSVLTARLPRAVRDMARRTGKRAQLVTQGDDQPLDRAIIEGLDAPLTHLLSNAVEHGIEAPDVRESLGKRPIGTITLLCVRVRDEIVVEVSDDGAGVDREKLANRAVEMGLLTRTRAEALAERDLGRLLCLPGLTSRDEPGENAGRGVGMDAVREMVSTLGGLLEVGSEVGSGTTVRLRLPRTPGISKLLLVEADGQVFGLPLSRVVNTGLFEPARIARDDVGLTVEHGGVRLRVHRLRDLLGLAEGSGPTATATAPDAAAAPSAGVVCQAEEGPFVLLVDRVVGQQDAVMKPLGPLLERIDGLLGVTIDPVGKPVFIVEVGRFIGRTPAPLHETR